MTSSPPTFKTVRGKDGRFYTETVVLPSAKDLEILRKETRDIIEGNTRIYIDPYAAPACTHAYSAL